MIFTLFLKMPYGGSEDGGEMQTSLASISLSIRLFNIHKHIEFSVGYVLTDQAIRGKEILTDLT